MARMVYSMIASLDGYIEDESGEFDWAAPDEEVHGFINGLERSVGTYLLGRRMYEVMAIWQDVPGIDNEPAVMQEYAEIWQGADKVVYSTTLPSVTTPRTRLERSFDPLQVHAMVTEMDRDVSIAGPTLAAHALGADVVDDVHLIVVPIIVGGGKLCWPSGARLSLELVDENRFRDGTVHLHYRAKR